MADVCLLLGRRSYLLLLAEIDVAKQRRFGRGVVGGFVLLITCFAADGSLGKLLRL